MVSSGAMTNTDKEVKHTWNNGSKFAFKFNKFILWPLGLWPTEHDSIFSWIRLVFAFVSQIWLISVQSMAAYLKCGDASDIVDFVMMAICSIMGLSKVLSIRIYMSKVRRIFLLALEDWMTANSEQSRKIMISFAKTGRTVFFVQMIFCYVSNTIMTISALPFLMPPMDNETSGNNTLQMPSRQLPLKSICVFGDYTDEIYGTLYVLDAIMMSLCAHSNVGCDVFFFSLIMHICGQIELLKKDILKIGPIEHSSTEVSPYRFEEIVKKHCQLLDSARNLNKTISGMLVVQLVLNAGMNLMLGLRVILAINSGLIFDAVRPIIAFTVLMLQLYLLSYASDRLSQQSESVIDAIYESRWYELPVTDQKDLYFMAMKTNKPIYMLAGQFYALNIENFMNVLKASFSYFSILRVMFGG